MIRQRLTPAEQSIWLKHKLQRGVRTRKRARKNVQASGDETEEEEAAVPTRDGEPEEEGDDDGY